MNVIIVMILINMIIVIILMNVIIFINLILMNVITFTFSHLADAFIQSDLQLGNT